MVSPFTQNFLHSRKLLNYNDNNTLQYIYYGTNTYDLKSPSLQNRWIRIILNGGGMTDGSYLGNFQIGFTDNTYYTLQQAVSYGYIEPLVVCSSSSHSRLFIYSNVNNVITGGNTSIGNFSNLIVIFKVKSIPVKSLRFYSNTNFNTTYDGFWVVESGETFDLSIQPY